MLKSAVYFIKFSYQYKKSYLFLSLLNQILHSITIIFNIYIPKVILDELFTNKHNIYAIYAAVILIIGNLIIRIFSNIIGMLAANEKNKLQEKFEIYLFDNLMTCDYENIESPKFYDLKEKAQNYIGGQWGEFGKQLDIIFELCGNIITLCTVLYLLSKLNSTIILIYIFLFVINNVVSSYYKKKSLQLQMDEMPAVLRKKSYYEGITKDISFSKEIRVNGLTEWILEHYAGYMKKFQLTTSKIYRCNLLVKLFSGITEAVQIMVTYGYLLYAVKNQNMTVGEFSMLLSAITLFNTTINAIISQFMDISRYKAYYNAFKTYINLPKSKELGHKTIKNWENGSIEFCDVSFKYPGQENYVLKNFSAKIDVNTKVSLVGMNGAGKSTLIKLLMGLYTSYEGEIKLNGINIKEYEEKEYRGLFSTAFQDYMLYAFSLKENICLSNAEKCSDAEVLKVMDVIGFSNKLEMMRNGLNTQIFKFFDANGVELSGGEGQKVGIARAVIRNTPIVILDEPTAALDPKAEYEIYANFDKLVKNKTVIYISHRLASSKICDKIIVLHNGKVEEEGTQEELIKRNGIYSKMYNMQSELYR